MKAPVQQLYVIAAVPLLVGAIACFVLMRLYVGRFRGRGLGTDVVLALCEYGFAVRGLHRLQVDTLASNAAMISAAVRAGFAQEGTLRGADWVNGEFADEVILGLLASDWARLRGAQ